jgi:hypothetical protein
MDKVDKLIQIIHNFKEEVGASIVNVVGSGQIAGTKEAGDDPPVYKKRSKKFIYGGKNSRKWWLQYLRKN